MSISGGRELKRQLQQMDDFEFEHFIADLWKQQGWETEVEQQSGDAGVDVRAVKTSPYRQKQLIQAKRYSNSTTVGGPDIQQYASLKQQEAGVDAAVIVTTSSFTRSAKNRAQDLNVKLVNGDDLVSMIDDLNAYDIVDRYVTTSTPKTGGILSTDTREQSAKSSTEKIQVMDLPFLTFEYPKGATPEDVDLTKKIWYSMIWGGIGAWILSAFLFFGTFTILRDIIILLGCLMVPIGIIRDMKSIGVFSSKDRNIWLVVITSAIPFLGAFSAAYYLLYRRGMLIDRQFSKAETWT